MPWRWSLFRGSKRITINEPKRHTRLIQRQARARLPAPICGQTCRIALGFGSLAITSRGSHDRCNSGRYYRIGLRAGENQDQAVRPVQSGLLLDTVLTVALADSILTKRDYASLMKAYYRRYQVQAMEDYFTVGHKRKKANLTIAGATVPLCESVQLGLRSIRWTKCWFGRLNIQQ